MSSHQYKLEVPLSLDVLEGGVAGVRYEIIPLLMKEIRSQEEFDSFGENMMDVIGDRYKIPMCGSAMWVIYKTYCKKDVRTFIECANTKEKQKVVMEWLYGHLRPS
jgi:hypothetical protein